MPDRSVPECPVAAKTRPLIHLLVCEHLTGMAEQGTPAKAVLVHPSDAAQMLEYAGANAYPRIYGVLVITEPRLRPGVVVSPL